MQDFFSRTPSRLNGLDTLRAIAIIIVLIYHYRVVVGNEDSFGFLSQLGWAGVDLFFVLSGYLIGNQVLASIVKGRDFSLRLFYIRRLLRTLPNYYVVLMLYFIFPGALAENVTAPLWKFFTFTQNIGLHYGETFTHSWSLCIEEQFYFIFPLAALLLMSSRVPAFALWIAMAMLVCVGVIMRYVAWLKYGPDISSANYGEHLYYASLTRFDEFLPGIAIAVLKNFHPGTFEKIQKQGQLFLATGLISTALMFYAFQHYAYIPGEGNGLVITVFGFPLLATCFAMLVLSAICPMSFLNKVRIPGAASLALWSYAIYLIHKPIFKIFKVKFIELNIDLNSAQAIAVTLFVGVLAGWILFMVVETPFMKLREKFYSTTRHANATQAINSF